MPRILDLLWHLRGSVSLDGVGSNQIVLDRLEQLLDRQWKSASERGADYLSFDDPLWSNLLSPNWVAMVIYDRGRFWIEQGRDGRALRYDLRSLHGMLFCVLAAFVAFFGGFADSGLSGGLKFAAGAFAWLYGMNILLAVVRLPSAIRSAVTLG